MPFHSAALLGDLHLLKILLSPPINVNAVSKRYGTALHAAAYERRPDVLRMLVDTYNADVTVTDQFGRTPLHLAARGGDVRCVDYLIERGLDCNDKDKNGNSVIHYACSGASIEVVRRVLYLDTFVMSSTKTWTPLHWAYRTGDIELINLLRRHGYSDSSVHTAQPSASWKPVSIGLFHRNPHVESAVHESPVHDFAVFGSTCLDTESLSNPESTTYPTGFHHEDFLCNECFHVSILQMHITIIANRNTGDIWASFSL
jgi:ankyrin repeat protein